jgi:hypothetical protein
MAKVVEYVEARRRRFCLGLQGQFLAEDRDQSQRRDVASADA